MIAVQAAVNNAVSILDFDFEELINIGDFQYGLNASGITLLNQGEDESFTSSFTLATSDFGEESQKRLRYLYIGIDTDNPFTVSVKTDEGAWRDYVTTPLKTGLQRLRVPIGSDGQGRYWTVKISSDYYFRIDSIDGLFIVRPSGIRGY